MTTRLLNNLSRAISNALSPAQRTNRKVRKTKRNRKNRTRTNRQNAAMPAAYASHVRPRFNVLSRSATSCRIAGCDLVYPIPAQLQENGDILFAVIPANPAYWIGTRVAQMAPAYMNYRPIRFTASYIPQVAVTEQGTVFMGTFWNGAAPTSNLQQSLFTSNGGLMTQCYVPADTTVRLGANLQQRLFTLNNALSEDTCPFIFLAGVRGTDVVPGYFYISYEFEFRNPIGSAWMYSASQPLTIAELSSVPTYMNMSLILLSGTSQFGPGTIVDYELDGKFYYHGSEIELDDSLSIQVFANEQTSLSTRLSKNSLTYNAIEYQSSGITFFRDFSPVRGGTTLSIPSGHSLILVQSALRPSLPIKIIMQGNSSGSAQNYTVSASSNYHYYYYMANFGPDTEVWLRTIDAQRGPGFSDIGFDGDTTLSLPHTNMIVGLPEYNL